MSQADFAVNVFVDLFALLDRLGDAPVFAAAGAPAYERAQIAVYVSLFRSPDTSGRGRA